MEHLADAVRLFRRRPELRAFVWKPLLIAFGLLVLLLIVSAATLMPLAQHWMAGLPLPAWLVQGVGLMVSIALWLMLAGPIYVTLAVTVSGMLWDPLSRQIERAEFGTEANRGPSFSVGMLDTAHRVVFAFALMGLGFCLSWVVPLVVPAILAAYLGIHDFTGPAFGRRGVLFGRQRRLVWKLRGGMSLAIACGVISVIPFLNVALMPILVAAGTLCVNRSLIDLPEDVRAP